MFESNDDVLDVDDEFLNEVFENEQNHFNSNFLSMEFENRQTVSQPIEAQCTVKSNTIEKSSTLFDFKTYTVTSPCIEEKNPITSQLNCPEQGLRENKNLQENNENKRKNCSSLMPIRTKRERKFPGPAGLLPDRSSRGYTPVKLDCLLEAEKPHSPTSDELCSQGRCSGSILEEEPWQNFLADLGPDKSILNEVNVASVKRKAAAKCFVGRKVPFLAAVLHHLDVSSPDPCIILRDSTGEIHGTLHREVWDQFAAELVVGAVLVVRNVGLLSTGLSSRRHYLNITSNNLVTIYSANSGKPKHLWLQAQDLAQSINNWRSLVSPSFGIGSPASVGSPGLFNSTVYSPFSNSSVPSPSISTESSSNIHRKTEVNRNAKLPIAVQKAPDSSKFNHVNLSSKPSIRNAAHEKNLRHSFSINTSNYSSKNENVSKNLFKICPNKNKLSKENFSIDCVKQISTSFVTSNLVQPVVKTRLKSSLEDTCNTKTFKFNPVILETKKFSSESFPQSNSERHTRNSEPVKTNTYLENNKTESKSANNNSKLVLSQSTQLTTEEQSLVESVFDGIDADSLFDDNF